MRSAWKARTVMKIVLGAAVAAALPPAVAAGDLLEKTDEKVLGEPTDTEAVVYFVRTAGLGAAIKFWAFADDRFVGLTRGRSYTFARVPEGKHLFWSKAENISTLEMEVMGGRTYYLQQEVRMGGLRARVRLSVMDEAEAKEALEKCKYVVTTPEGMERGAEVAKDKWAKAQQREDEKEKWDEGEEAEEPREEGGEPSD